MFLPKCWQYFGHKLWFYFGFLPIFFYIFMAHSQVRIGHKIWGRSLKYCIRPLYYLSIRATSVAMGYIIPVPKSVIIRMTSFFTIFTFLVLKNRISIFFSDADNIYCICWAPTHNYRITILLTYTVYVGQKTIIII